MLLIDAYNVLGVEGVLDGQEALFDVTGLIGLVTGTRIAGRRVVLVCDGAPPPKAPRGVVRGVEVVYAGAGRDADTLIGKLLRESSSARRALVVSSDRRVRADARRVGARDISSEDFLAGLRGMTRREGGRRPGPREATPLAPEAVREWVEAFGLRASDLMDIAGTAATPRAPAARVDGGRVVGPGAGAPLVARHDGAPLGEDLRALLARLAPTLDPGELDMDRWVDGVVRLRDE